MSPARSAFGLAVPQPPFPSPQDRLRPIRHLQFAEDVGDMVAYRFEGEAQLIRDLLVAAALRYQCQQFRLSFAQFWKHPGRDGCPGRREEAEDTFGNARAEDGLPAGHCPDCPQDLGLVRALEDVATRSRAHGGKDRFIVFEHGDHQDADVWAGRHNLSCGRDAIDARHLDVHQDHIGLQGLRLCNGLGSGGGLPNHLGLAYRIQEAMHALAKEWMLVCNEHTDTVHAYSSWGTMLGVTTSAPTV